MDGRMLPAKSCRSLGILGLALVLIAWLPATGRGAGMDTHGKGLLDGKTFAVETGDTGKGGSDKDTLVFRNGMLHSLACDKYGFGEGVYTATEQDGAMYFEAETKSPSKGTISWRGTIRGDRIESIYTWLDSPHWYKRSPKPVEKWARGQLKKP